MSNATREGCFTAAFPFATAYAPAEAADAKQERGGSTLLALILSNITQQPRS